MMLATFEEGRFAREARTDELLALDEVLLRLEAMNERQRRVVTYRLFEGLTHEEIAEVLMLSSPKAGSATVTATCGVPSRSWSPTTASSR